MTADIAVAYFFVRRPCRRRAAAAARALAAAAAGVLAAAADRVALAAPARAGQCFEPGGVGAAPRCGLRAGSPASRGGRLRGRDVAGGR